MEIKGKLVKIMPPITGQGKNGEWKRQEFIIELEGAYPRKVCISTWGDKVNVGLLNEGSIVNVFYDIESREYQGKWYTSITAWKVDVVEENVSSPPQPDAKAEETPFEPQPPVFGEENDEESEVKDDLPF